MFLLTILSPTESPNVSLVCKERQADSQVDDRAHFES